METKIVEGLAYLVTLSFIIERALAMIFEWKVFEKIPEAADAKPVIAVIASIVVCFLSNFDIVYVISVNADIGVTWPQPRPIGILLTGMTVAGGSAASIKLFQDVLGFRRTAREERRAAQQADQEAKLAEAQSRIVKARSEAVVAESIKQTAVMQSLSPGLAIPEINFQDEQRFASRFMEIATGR